MTGFQSFADGLMFPEGPVAFPDGSVIVVEIAGGTVRRLWGEGRSEIVAEPGGGPNGAALGPDGALYVCNNGGMGWTRGPKGEINPTGLPPETPYPGCIERIDLATGACDRLYERCGDHALSAPNDLVFDASGGFWFTALGKHHARSHDASFLYYARPDGSEIIEVTQGLSFNGVGLSPDGETLYVADTHSARLWSWPIEGPGKLGAKTLVGTAPGDVGLDSLAVTEAGNICVGTLYGAPGITTFTPQGETDLVPLPDIFTTNICFGGPDRKTAFVTLSHIGRVVTLDWPEAGLALEYCSY